MCKTFLKTSHTLISGTNVPKMGFEKCIQTVQDIYFSAVCTEVADPLKVQNVHLLQLTVQGAVLVAEVQRKVEEPCRDLLEPRLYSFKPMATVKSIGGDKGCKDIHCLFSLVCADCEQSLPSVIHSPTEHESEMLSTNIFTLNVQPILIDVKHSFWDHSLSPSFVYPCSKYYVMSYSRGFLHIN